MKRAWSGRLLAGLLFVGACERPAEPAPPVWYVADTIRLGDEDSSVYMSRTSPCRLLGWGETPDAQNIQQPLETRGKVYLGTYVAKSRLNLWCPTFWQAEMKLRTEAP